MSLTRELLIKQARALECFSDPEQRTDKELQDAINAETAAAAWLDRLEQLPTDEAKRAAVHRLRLDLEDRASVTRAAMQRAKARP